MEEKDNSNSFKNLQKQLADQNEYNDVKQDSRIEYISNQLTWINRWLFLILSAIILPKIIEIVVKSFVFTKIISYFTN